MCITRHAGSRLQAPFYLHGVLAGSAGNSPGGRGWVLGACGMCLPSVTLSLGHLWWFFMQPSSCFRVLKISHCMKLFPAFSLQTHLVSGIQVPLENSCFISLDMNNLHQSLLWLAGIWNLARISLCCFSACWQTEYACVYEEHRVLMWNDQLFF